MTIPKSNSSRQVIFLAVLIFSLFAVPWVIKPATGDSGASWLSGWRYRKSLVINSATGAGTNYDVGVTVYYTEATTSWQPYYDLSSSWTTIVGDPSQRHGFDPVHETRIVEVDKEVDGATRKYLAYDSDPDGVEIRLYYTDDLDGTWTAYSGNPILGPSSTHFRIPSVAWDGSIFHMFLNDRNEYTIKRYTSTDGIHYTFQENVLTDTGYSYKAPYIWLNPNDNKWYLYWLKVSGGMYQIVARNSTAITGLAGLSDVVVWSAPSATQFAFATIMYRDNAYWMVGETPVGAWEVRALKSTTSPTSGFKECSNSPILTADEACPISLLSPDGTKAYLFTNRGSSYWHQDTREILSTFPAGPPTPPQLSVEGHSKTDFGDIRFTDSTGSNLLNYWMQEKVDGDHAKFWVKITDNLGSSDATIYTYYGNNQATTTSNGDNTFPFFDHFSGTSLDTNKWTSSGTVSVSNSIATISSNNAYIIGKTSFAVGNAYEAHSTTSGGSSSLILTSRDATWSYYNHIFPGYAVSQLGTPYTRTGIATGPTMEYHNYRIARVSSSETRFYYDDTLEATHTTNTDPQNEAAAFLDFGTASYVDWVFIRKFVSTEPYLKSWGSEELLLSIVQSCDSGGSETNTFNIGDQVYATGSKLKPSSSYNIYIVRHYTNWIRGATELTDLSIVIGPIPVSTDSAGNIVDQPKQIWASASQGSYDIFADCQDAGTINKYDDYDAVDGLEITVAGFFVIPEYVLGTILALGVCFAGFTAYRRFRYNRRKTL